MPDGGSGVSVGEESASDRAERTRPVERADLVPVPTPPRAQPGVQAPDGGPVSADQDNNLNLGSGTGELDQDSPTPREARYVTLYHVGCTAGAVALMGCAYKQLGIFDDPVFRTAALSIGAGVAGGTLTASRYVVYSVRHRSYDSGRMLWQLMTPLHSGVFAGFSLALGQAGLVIASEQLNSTASGYIALVISLSFLIGFSSELFVKRLIAASEALFGEPNGLEGTDLIEKRKKSKREK